MDHPDSFRSGHQVEEVTRSEQRAGQGSRTAKEEQQGRPEARRMADLGRRRGAGQGALEREPSMAAAGFVPGLHVRA